MEGSRLAAAVPLGCASVCVSTEGSVSQSFLPCSPIPAPLADKTASMAYGCYVTEATRVFCCKAREEGRGPRVEGTSRMGQGWLKPTELKKGRWTCTPKHLEGVEAL